jgi:hypothetical protein
MRKKMKKFAAGGDAAQTARYARKTADIESDYQKALKAGRSSGIAKAKYEQRMADAADDLAKWTRSDRTQTRAAESAAEKALSEARRTKGVSALRSQTPAVFKSMMDEAPIGVTSGMEVGRVASPSTTRATPRPRATPPAPRREAPAPKPTSGVTFTAGNGLEQEQARLRLADALQRQRAALAKRGSAMGSLQQADPDFKYISPLGEGDMRAKGGAIKKKPMMKFAKGGSIDGCAIRGKTRVGRK